MQKMFQGKNESNLEGKVVVEVKTLTVDVNVINVNVVQEAKSQKNKCSKRKNKGRIKVL